MNKTPFHIFALHSNYEVRRRLLLRAYTNHERGTRRARARPYPTLVRSNSTNAVQEIPGAEHVQRLKTTFVTFLPHYSWHLKETGGHSQNSETQNSGRIQLSRTRKSDSIPSSRKRQPQNTRTSGRFRTNREDTAALPGSTRSRLAMLGCSVCGGISFSLFVYLPTRPSSAYGWPTYSYTPPCSHAFARSNSRLSCRVIRHPAKGGQDVDPVRPADEN